MEDGISNDRSQEEENRGENRGVFLSFFLMLSACLREVFGRRARGGASEGYTESTKNLERGVRIHPHPDSTFQKARIHGGIKYRSPPSMPGIPTLVLDKM